MLPATSPTPHLIVVSTLLCLLSSSSLPPLLPIGVRDGGQGGSCPPIQAVCRHEFGQRVEMIRAKHNRRLNNTNLGSVIAANGKKNNLEPVTAVNGKKIMLPHRTWTPENFCSVCPPKWMLARTPMLLPSLHLS